MPYLGNIPSPIILQDVLGNYNFDYGTLYIDSVNNRVGIGTSSPSYTLDINGSARSNYILFGSNSSAPTADAAIYRPGDGTLGLVTNSTERMRITSDGNVGIGTTSPNSPLHVSRAHIASFTGTTTGALTLDGTYTNGNFNAIDFTHNDSTPFARIASQHTGGGTYLAFGTSNNYGSGITNQALTIDPSGNVGIGTTTPAAGLEVGRNQAGAPTGLRITAGSTVAAPTLTFNYADAGTDSKRWTMFNDIAGNFNLARQTDAGVNNVRLHVTNAGNVGIGTTSPSSTLEVNGSFAATSKSFIIPHPLPDLSETNNLVHSNVEAPTADNIYRGKIQLVNGQATVNIDTYVGMTEGTFSALNGNIQVFLQNESGWDLVRGSVSDNILTIISQNQSSTDTISWMVIGERQDQHMLDTQWTDEFGRPILEPLKEPEPDVALPPEPEVPNENG